MQGKILGFDIEATHLKASFGHIICCSFVNLLDPDDPVVTFRIDELKGKRISDDSRVVKKIKEKLEDTWIWAGWYSKHYDVPFINGRLALHGFLPVEKRMHLDLLYYSKGQFMRLHSSKLDSVAKTFQLKNQKTDILPDEWLRAGEGDKAAIDYVVEHCEADVKVLRDVFPILMPHIANIHK
jgi:uncharacterized protein YprB with RNaseH-like and TPR domain